jgi:RNA polymerase sigma-70 factor (ECF subfamily)
MAVDLRLAVTSRGKPEPGPRTTASAAADAASAVATHARRPTLAELFQAHAAMVWRVVAGHGVPASDVQDVTQEVFLIAFRKIDEWDPARSSATSWLYGIAIRVAANHRRLAHLRRETPGEPPQVSVLPDPTGSIERTRLLAQLDDALAAMEPQKRNVFILFEIAELSMHEVARTEGCPLKTAYKRLYAARREVAARFGVAWGSRGGGEDDERA